MRIAIIVESFPKLSETFILNHIKGLIDAGTYVKIFSFNRPATSDKIHNVFFEYSLQDNVKYKPSRPSNIVSYFFAAFVFFVRLFLRSPSVALKIGKRLSLNAVFEATLFINDDKFDIVHCHFGTMATEFLRYKDLGFKNIPIVTTFHGYDIDHVEIRSNKDYYTSLIQSGKLFIANSEYTRSRLVEIGFDVDKTRVIPVSLDINKFSRQVSGLPANNGKVVIITAGRLVEFKGVQFSIQAIAQLVEGGLHNMEYKIIGDGPLAAELRQWVAERKLNAIISFLGGLSQEELLLEFSNADIFMLTGVKAADGREENQGLVIQEAQAMQLPVIVSDVGGVREGMIDGKTGFLVRQKDISAIAGKLRSLIDDRNMRIKMGREGRSFVEKNFSIEVCTSKLLKEYSMILSEPARQSQVT